VGDEGAGIILKAGKKMILGHEASIIRLLTSYWAGFAPSGMERSSLRKALGLLPT